MLFSAASVSGQEALTVASDRANYAYGDVVLITGKVQEYTEGAKGTLKVLTSKNKVFLEKPFTPNADGTFSYAFKLEGSILEEGLWTARVSYQAKNAIASFSVLEHEVLEAQVRIVVGASNPNNAVFYEPKETTVKRGAKITWKNDDVSSHTITYGVKDSPGIGSLFNSGNIRSGAIYERTFPDEGEYPYFCTLYPWMTGKVIVLKEIQIPITVELAMSTDKERYKAGETVKVTGSASPVQDKDVTLQVLNPDEMPFTLGQFRPQPDGKFTYSFPLKGDILSGNYMIRVTYLNKTISNTIIVEAPLPTPAPEPEPQLTEMVAAERVSFIDITGVEKDSLGVGEQVLVQSRLSNMQSSEQEFVFIVQVKDSDDVVIMLSWFQSTLNPKQTVSVAQSWTPEGEGRFTVQAFVWRNILDPVPLTKASLQSTIKVT
jgi:plastocyanin